MIRAARKSIINKIVKKIPFDFSKHCTRDISLLSCSIFGESHMIVEKIFEVRFSVTFWVVRGSLVNFYRSEREYFEFSKKIGELCRNARYAKWLAEELIKMTDWFNDFLKRNKRVEDLVKNNKIFFDNYRRFFAYHQAVNWGGNYLARLSFINKKEKNKIDQIVKRLDTAYKYNEMVVPNLEKYFRKLRINHLLYDEVDGNVYKNIKSKPRNRSLIFIKKKRIILSNSEAKQIEKIINRKLERFKNLREFKGLGASGGFFRGKVKLILDLNKFKKCQKGDVLVTTMTRPQFNEFIKQVGAIITDEGGMLCHASILSREFKIPCIVGTKIATKVLKDGDLVEVDADRGVVRIIK